MWKLVLILQFASGFCNQPPTIYTAIAPRTIYPEASYNVSITVEDGGQPTLFSAIISSGTTSYAAQEMSIAGGESRTLTLNPLNLAIEKEMFNLTLKASNPGNNTESTVLIYVDKKNYSLFIQSDKSIYKPGETIRFRVLVLDRFLRPFKKGQIVQIKIYNPMSSVIKVWKNAKTRGGLVSTTLKLADEPNLGLWSIEAKAGDQMVSHELEVAEYVLPKFKVDVKLPKYITLNASSVVVEISAKYTYGKEIKGECTVTLSPKEFYSYWEIGKPGIQANRSVTKTMPINGKAVLEFSSITENKFMFERQAFFRQMDFDVRAAVTDEITKKVMNGSSSVTMYEHPYKIEYVDQASAYEPGLPFKMTFKVSTQDGVPIGDESPEALTVIHGFSYRAEDGISKSAIPPNGTVTFSFITPSNEQLEISTVEVLYKDLKEKIFLPGRVRSESKTYLQLNVLSNNIKANEEMRLNVQCTKEFTSLNYIIYGRSVWTGKISLKTPAKSHDFNIQVPICAAPEAKILVYAIFPPNNEIVSTVKRFKAESTISNFLDVKLSTETSEPGQNVTIKLKTNPKSLVAIRGVDQSVLLLKEDKDLTKSKFDEELKRIEQNRNDENRFYGGSGSFLNFEEAGLVILTNGWLERDQSVPWGLDGGGWRGGEIPEAMPMMAVGSYAELDDDVSPRMGKSSKKMLGRPGSGSASDNLMQVVIRKNFPETWLWEEYLVWQSNSSFEISRTVPDTMTSWLISGYSLNPTLGVGVLGEPQTLKTFRPFFISLNLPYSVVRNEIVTLQVLIHNYLEGESQDVTITFENKDGALQFPNSKVPAGQDQMQTLNVNSNQVTVAKFTLIPKTIGTIFLNLKATTPMAGDGLSQPLRVKPQGHKQTKNAVALLDLRETQSGEKKKYRLSAIFPEKRVKGADGVKLSLVADILGGSISNLDNLLEMPCGCGEQNMLNFAPDVFILNYLRLTKQLTPAIRVRAVSYLESGYQRELTYRHDDGSFSSFGRMDATGSTWLTAFVVRSFIHAKTYITVDNNVILLALEFLKEQQSTNGSFVEKGHVLSSDMQGVSSAPGLALTAFTLLSFIDYSRKFKDEVRFRDVIAKGLSYVAQSSNLDTKDLYALNLVVYTLHRAHHPNLPKEWFFQVMMSKAEQDGDFMHWEVKGKQRKEDEHNPYVHKTKPISVEMTAYALLTILQRKNMEDALKVVKWLLKQRNAQGGFISTQDTVVGLSALTKFAAVSKAAGTDLTIKAKYTGGKQIIRANDENSIVLQEFYLPEGTREVNLTVKGSGTAVAQLTWSYYVKAPSQRPAFTITVELDNQDPNLFLKVCTALVAGNHSNMAVMEINLPSGYTVSEFVPYTLNLSTLKRHEMEEGDSRLIIYFDAITKAKTCVTLQALRAFHIGKLAPAYIRVYDYYDTTKVARSFYKIPEQSTCKKDQCGGDVV